LIDEVDDPLGAGLGDGVVGAPFVQSVRSLGRGARWPGQLISALTNDLVQPDHPPIARSTSISTGIFVEVAFDLVDAV
jgi:hypothetical protein